MTTLELPLRSARDARIASLFFRKAFNTNEIAQTLKVPEYEVANRMGVARAIWREWMREAA